MTVVTLPGLVDVHTHMRDPGQTHKEDWATGTAAALAGGFTAVLAMPNTIPPVVDAVTLAGARAAAASGSRVDWGLYLGATDDNASAAADLAGGVSGLKMYLDHTFGDLRLHGIESWWSHMEAWPGDRPVTVHAEGRSLVAILLMARLLGRPVHLCHVSRRIEIEMIRRAKDSGDPVTCEVAPHHLFLSAEDAASLGPLAAVRPGLGSPDDVAALWEHLEAVDVFASDHAPHTVAEKESAEAPPGFPGLETALPLLIEAVHDGRLDLEGITTRLDANPRRIHGLPAQDDSWTEVDVDAPWVVAGPELLSKCGWTPFEGRTLRGRVRRVAIRGAVVYDEGKVLAAPGTGHDMKEDM